MARSIDDKVVEVFLSAMAPPELDLSLSVLKEVEHQAAEVDQQWKLRLERVRYEVARAERQYHAVEPENRIVARTLETRWNQKLQELLQVEREYEEARRTHKLDLSDEDKQAIRALAADLPKVWNAQTTTTTERKQLLRLAIQDIVLAPLVEPHRATQIRILWKTGAVTETTVQRPLSGDRIRTPPEVLALVTEQVKQGKSYVQIADDLNQRKLKSGRGREFTRRVVSMICQGYGLTILRPPGVNRPGQRAQERDPRGRYSIAGLVARYHITYHVVRYWIQCGVLTPQRDCPGGPFWFDLTPDAEARIAQALRSGYGPRDRR
jgi:hypothetical protein